MKLTQEYVHELFCYDYDTGKLYWRVNKSNGRKGNEVGTDDGRGYLKTSINKKMYKLHRIIYLYHHGYIPENDVDHEDRDRKNNKIHNLREISKSCNVNNQGLSKTNTSGVKGICRYKGKWRSRICINKKELCLGSYTDFTEAVYARFAAEQCTNYYQCDSNSSAYQYIKSHHV